MNAKRRITHQPHETKTRHAARHPIAFACHGTPPQQRQHSIARTPPRHHSPGIRCATRPDPHTRTDTTTPRRIFPLRRISVATQWPQLRGSARLRSAHNNRDVIGRSITARKPPSRIHEMTTQATGPALLSKRPYNHLTHPDATRNHHISQKNSNPAQLLVVNKNRNHATGVPPQWAEHRKFGFP